MDQELESYVDEVMGRQQYRSGVFRWNITRSVLNGMSMVKAGVDLRGRFGLPGNRRVD